MEAKIAMRSPDEMDVDELTWWNADKENENEEIHSLGKGGIYCYRCGGQGHIASKCGTPEPQKGKGKGFKGQGGKDGKGGKSGKGGKGKHEWTGFCSYCGKQGHGPRDCWTKQHDEENNGGGGKGGGVSSVDDAGMNNYHGSAQEGCHIGGFDIAAVDFVTDRVECSSKDIPLNSVA